MAGSLVGVVAEGQTPRRIPAVARATPGGAPVEGLGADRAELRRRGEATFNEYLAESGRGRDPSWESRIDTLVARLAGATGIPDLELTWALTNDASPNAVAIPGGYVVIFRGMLRFVDSVAAKLAPGDRTAMSTRATSMLASVVAHELAHVTLHHGDTPTGAPRPRGANAAPPATRAMPGVSHDVLQQQGISRKEEDEADRTGALFLARSGYSIEGALDVMRALDALERARGVAGRSVNDVTWLRGHPRPAARLAALEGYRAQLRARQSNLDDALTLLGADTDPQLAVELLDSVLTDFPSLAAARHARAAALQQQYVAQVPVSALKVRPSTPTFSSEFLLSVRGDAKGAALLLTGARRDYEQAMGVEVHPYTLSALAVLDAWSGDSAKARERSQRAEATAPNDVDVLNNLGVVRYLAGDARGARTAFERAVRFGGDSLPSRILFNYARVLLDDHDPEGERVMGAYLLRDPSSAWAAMGRALLPKSAPSPADASLGTTGRPAADAASPSVFGVQLGTLPGQVVQALGDPPNAEHQGVNNVWRYPDRALTIVLTPREGVVSLALSGRPSEEAQILGLHVGDPMSAVRAALGEPTEIFRDRLSFVRAGWGVVIERKFGLISRLALQLR